MGRLEFRDAGFITGAVIAWDCCVRGVMVVVVVVVVVGVIASAPTDACLHTSA